MVYFGEWNVVYTMQTISMFASKEEEYASIDE